MSGIPLGQIDTEGQIDRVALLRGMPLFASLSDDRLHTLAAVTRACQYPDGAEIIEEGDLPVPENDGLYLLINGTAVVTKGANGNDTGTELATLGPGEFFGEMALLDGYPRSASVFATSEVLCLILSRTDLHRILRSDPEIALKMLAVLSQRLRAVDQRS